MTKTIKYRVIRCSHLEQWQQFLAILRLIGSFIEVRMVRGKEKDSLIFLLLTNIKEKRSSAFGEKNSVSHFSERSGGVTAST